MFCRSSPHFTPRFQTETTSPRDICLWAGFPHDQCAAPSSPGAEIVEPTSTQMMQYSSSFHEPDPVAAEGSAEGEGDEKGQGEGAEGGDRVPQGPEGEDLIAVEAELEKLEKQLRELEGQGVPRRRRLRVNNPHNFPLLTSPTTPDLPNHTPMQTRNVVGLKPFLSTFVFFSLACACCWCLW